MVDYEFIKRCGNFILWGAVGSLFWIFNAYVFWLEVSKKRKRELYMLPVGGLLLGVSWWNCPWGGNVLRTLCWLPFLTDGIVVSLMLFLFRRFYRRAKCSRLKSLRRKERQ